MNIKKQFQFMPSIVFLIFFVVSINVFGMYHKQLFYRLYGVVYNVNYYVTRRGQSKIDNRYEGLHRKEEVQPCEFQRYVLIERSIHVLLLINLYFSLNLNVYNVPNNYYIFEKLYDTIKISLKLLSVQKLLALVAYKVVAYRKKCTSEN